MKKSILFLSAVTIALVSCKKNKTSADGAQVNLAATTFYKDGSMETKRDRSGAFNTTSYGQLTNDGGTNKFLVNLGAAGTTHTLAVFGLSFVFNRQTTAEGIAGSYSFPRDQAIIRVTLRNEVVNTVSENLFFPARGTVNFAYDTASKKISGSVQDLEFSIIPNDPYNRYRITVDGSFSAIPVQ
ncbi:hypothetical protein [Ferruginibacter sp. SUN106]|uniref:hypothetical protein n=1 Tax=Ferruginibacter sp. SUN106 TaxID=2978348 RepID=UPI003D361A06